VSYRSGSGKGGGSVIAGFIVGCILIGIAIPLVWMNERRDVHTYNVIQKARRAVRKADCNMPDPYLNTALVHMTGRA
jgi:hypothetical protein